VTNYTQQYAVRMSLKFETYVEEKELFSNYLERFDFYCTVNSVNDNQKKKAFFLSCVGADAYSKIRTQLKPEKPQDKSYVEVVAAAKLIYKQQLTVIGLRSAFMSRKRRENETVSAYALKLREMCGDCEYPNDFQNQALRDVFTMGLNLPSVQAKLMLKDNTLTFEEAQAKELAAKSSAEFNNPTAKASISTEREVHRVQSNSVKSHRRQTSTKTANDVAGRNCYRCGGNHEAAKCRFKNEQCHNCKKRGHIAKVCRSKYAQPSRDSKVAHVEEDDDLRLYHVNAVHDTSGVFVDIRLDRASIKMQVDTGCGVSIIPESFYRNNLSQYTLTQNTQQLTSYSGDTIPVLGKIDIPVAYKTQQHTLSVVVAKGEKPALMGRDWLKKVKLDWCEVFTVNETKTMTMKSCLDSFADLFVTSEEPIFGFTAKIKPKEGINPVFQRARPVPYALREVVEEELDRLEAAGVWQRVTGDSEWASPTVNVPKMKNGKMTVRICGDYKRLNQAIEDDKYPLPTAQDLFVKLAHKGKKPTVFSILDLSGAYNQLAVSSDTAPLLTLNTHKGMYRPRRLAYGVKTAPAIFQATMDHILSGVNNVICYLDDILIIGESKEEHIKTLNIVIERLRQHNIRLNKSKCEFMQSKVRYLGHIVSAEGIQPINSKVDAMNKAPAPTNLTELQSFLGGVQYYARFVPNMSSMLHPLYQRLQAGVAWSWDEECEAAFKKCKQTLTSSCVLTHYDSSKKLILATDASPYGVGAVISHVMEDGSERPIAYASRTLNSAEKKYAQIEREGLAIIFGLKKFQNYLYGRHFVLVTDHRPLVRIFGPKTDIPALAASRIQRWALILAGYQYDIQFKTSKQNANADVLSRLPLSTPDTADPDEQASVNMMSMKELPVTAKMIAEATSKDPTLARVYDYTHHGWQHVLRGESLYQYFSRKDELSLEDGCILIGRRVVIPPCYREQLLQELHAMHPGIVRMKALARGYVWWPGLDGDIEEIVRACPACVNVRNMPTKAPLRPWPWASQPWQRIHIDFAEVKGQDFLIVVDNHSKWLEVIPMSTTTSSKTITELRKLFAAYGLPQEVVSDNGPQLTSDEFGSFLKLNGVKHTLTPPYHPATNGLAERNVQTFKKMFAKSSDNLPLHHRVSDIVFKYRNTPHSLTGKTPSELFLLRAPRIRLTLTKPHLKEQVERKQLAQAKLNDTTSKKLREFVLYQQVKVRNMRGRGERWLSGMIVEKLGDRIFRVRLGGGIRTVHIDQMIDNEETAMPSSTIVPIVPVPDLGEENGDTVEEQSQEPPENSVAESATVKSAPVDRSELRRSSRTPKPIDRLNL